MQAPETQAARSYMCIIMYYQYYVMCDAQGRGRHQLIMRLRARSIGHDGSAVRENSLREGTRFSLRSLSQPSANDVSPPAIQPDRCARSGVRTSTKRSRSLDGRTRASLIAACRVPASMQLGCIRKATAPLLVSAQPSTASTQSTPPVMQLDSYLFR